MSCHTITDFCLSCNNNDAYWKGYNNKKFPQDPSLFNLYQTNVIGGVNNSKNTKTTASEFTLFKKTLTTVKVIPNNLPEHINTGTPNTSYTNVGGPGDAVKSVPIITSHKTGHKARLISATNQVGVDVKHNSYNRYLARKVGLHLKCQNC